MSGRKNTVRKRLAEYQAAIDAMSERLDDIGFVCPYATSPNELGETEYMMEFDEDGNGALPDFCSLSGSTDYFGEYDEDCTGAKDGKSCWLHYYGVIQRAPSKFRRITRRHKRLRAAKPELIFIE